VGELIGIGALSRAFVDDNHSSATLAVGSGTIEIAEPNPGFTVTFPSATEVKYPSPAGTINFARLRVTGP